MLSCDLRRCHVFAALRTVRAAAARHPGQPRCEVAATVCEGIECKGAGNERALPDLWICIETLSIATSFPVNMGPKV